MINKGLPQIHHTQNILLSNSITVSSFHLYNKNYCLDDKSSLDLDYLVVLLGRFDCYTSYHHNPLFGRRRINRQRIQMQKGQEAIFS